MRLFFVALFIFFTLSGCGMNAEEKAALSETRLIADEARETSILSGQEALRARQEAAAAARRAEESARAAQESSETTRRIFMESGRK